MRVSKAVLWLLLCTTALLVWQADIARARPLSATTINVTTTQDELDSNAECSLREAVRAANLDQAVGACPAGSGADTINLPAGVYTLSILGTDENASLTGDLDILDDLTITGAGKNDTFIDAGQIDRAIHVNTASATDPVHISDLTIQNGLEQTDLLRGGAGIQNERGSLTVQDVVLQLNETSRLGGGLNNVSTTYLIDVTLFGNQAEKGGGIFNEGTLNLTRTTFTNNSSDFTGGALDNSREVTMLDVLMQGNQANDGGAIFSDGSLDVTDSTFTGNQAAQGGAIRNAGYTTLSSSTFYLNTATSGGALYNTDNLFLRNTTISDNTATGSGGGIYNDGSLIVQNTTIAYNSSGVYLDPTIVSAYFDNTMIVHSTTTNCSGAGSVNQSGVNLDSQNTCNFDLHDIDPMITSLGDHGAKTLMHALLPGSPAIDGGENLDCLPVDQRGATRPVDGDGDVTQTCDIGTYEEPTQFPQRLYIPYSSKNGL